jgi:hypothetical protein
MNARICRDEAALLAARGMPANLEAYVDGLLTRAADAGWKRIEREPARTGGGSSAEARARAKAEVLEKLAAIREGRKKPRGAYSGAEGDDGGVK